MVKKTISTKKFVKKSRKKSTQILVKKYVVRLSAAEREPLEALIRKGKNAAGYLLKARILLKADVSDAGDGWSDSRIIEALETNALMVYRVRKQLVEEGFEAVFTRKRRETPPVPRIFDGEKEARRIALSCSKPPAGYARWSVRRLEKKVVELDIVDAASDSTIGRVLGRVHKFRQVFELLRVFCCRLFQESLCNQNVAHIL